MKRALLHLMKSVKFEVPAFEFGGILIDEDGGKGSRIALRERARWTKGSSRT